MDRYRDIPGFKTLKVTKLGRLWYIIDLATGGNIGPFFIRLKFARQYAADNYKGQYT
jgi:hypothetical protein